LDVGLKDVLFAAGPGGSPPTWTRTDTDSQKTREKAPSPERGKLSGWEKKREELTSDDQTVSERRTREKRRKSREKRTTAQKKDNPQIRRHFCILCKEKTILTIKPKNTPPIHFKGRKEMGEEKESAFVIKTLRDQEFRALDKQQASKLDPVNGEDLLQK